MNTKLPMLLLALQLPGCNSINNAEFEKHLHIVTTIASPGKNIETAKKEIKKRGYDVSDTFYTNKFKEGKFIEVRYGASVGFADSALYSADLHTSGEPTSILVESNAKGNIILVH